MHALIATDGSEVSIEAARQGVALLQPTKVPLLTVADTSVAEDSGGRGFEGDLLHPAEAPEARTAILDEGAAQLAHPTNATTVDPSTPTMPWAPGRFSMSGAAVSGEKPPSDVIPTPHTFPAAGSLTARTDPPCAT